MTSIYEVKEARCFLYKDQRVWETLVLSKVGKCIVHSLSRIVYLSTEGIIDLLEYRIANSSNYTL